MMAKYGQIKEQLEPPFFIEYAKKDAKAAAEEEAEAEEIESESGVADVAAAPGTVAETKPEKRGKNAKANAEPVRRRPRASSSSTSSSRAARSTRSSATRDWAR